MVNRAALILRYKEPAVRWINEADPHPLDKPFTLADVDEEHTVYLISDDDGDSSETVDRWIRRNCKTLFEMELNGWYTDPALWPKRRSLKVFREWFDVEYHTVLIDTVEEPLLDDGEMSW